MRADDAAGAAVCSVRLEIDADAAAIGETLGDATRPCLRRGTGAAQTDATDTAYAAGAAIVRVGLKVETHAVAVGEAGGAGRRGEADSSLAGLAGPACVAAGAAVDRAGEQIGAVAAAIGGSGGALRIGAGADAALAELIVLALPIAGAAVEEVTPEIDASFAANGKWWGAVLNTVAAADASRAGICGADILAGAAMKGIRAEIPAAIDCAAVGDANWAICPLADAAATFHRHQVALADRAAGPAIVLIGQEIDAGAATTDQASGAGGRARNGGGRVLD